jgi:signal transduction histidine kinase
MEGTLLNKANEEIPVRLSGTLIYEQQQEVGSVVFIQDLREIHRLQQEKEHAERMAAIGRTVAGVAHYIKNILTGLQGGSYVINSAMSRKDLELVEKGWDMVERNIDQIAHIVTDMLIYSTERTPDYKMVDPNELITEVLELMEVRARTAGVTVIRDLQPGLRMVNMDKTGIHRCLLNLIGNAIDACTLEGLMNGKGIVTVKTDSPDGRGVRYRVSDNGKGMDVETQQRLFTDFFTTKGYKGTGLGLPVTKKIIEEHGGELSFKSRVGQGTTFTLILPKGT